VGAYLARHYLDRRRFVLSAGELNILRSG
jgi:hypothetical protein